MSDSQNTQEESWDLSSAGDVFEFRLDGKEAQLREVPGNHADEYLNLVNNRVKREGENAIITDNKDIQATLLQHALYVKNKDGVFVEYGKKNCDALARTVRNKLFLKALAMAGLDKRAADQAKKESGPTDAGVSSQGS